jgi:hypothetical protein
MIILRLRSWRGKPPSLLLPIFYQRNPKAIGIMPTVPLPKLLGEARWRVYPDVARLGVKLPFTIRIGFEGDPGAYIHAPWLLEKWLSTTLEYCG